MSALGENSCLLKSQYRSTHPSVVAFGEGVTGNHQVQVSREGETFMMGQVPFHGETPANWLPLSLLWEDTAGKQLSVSLEGLPSLQT